MQTVLSKEDGKMVFTVTGRLDTNTSSSLEAEVTGALDTAGESPQVIVFNFSGLEYISSAGLRVLIMAQKRIAPAGGKVCVRGACTMVRSVLDMTGLSTLLGIE